MKKQMTFGEGIKLSWKQELEIKDPERILRLAWFTVYFGAIHLLFFALPNQLVRLAKALNKIGNQLTK